MADGIATVCDIGTDWLHTARQCEYSSGGRGFLCLAELCISASCRWLRVIIRPPADHGNCRQKLSSAGVLTNLPTDRPTDPCVTWTGLRWCVGCYPCISRLPNWSLSAQVWPGGSAAYSSSGQGQRRGAGMITAVMYSCPPPRLAGRTIKKYQYTSPDWMTETKLIDICVPLQMQ